MRPVSVSRLNGYISHIIKQDPYLSDICVRGELSNIRSISTGHVYFSLKDEFAEVQCFMLSSVFEKLGFMPENGMLVLATGYISVYEKKGTYSLNIRKLEAEGAGALAQAFEAMKKKLENEGMFSEDRKREIPTFPKTIGIVTAAGSAALADMLKIIKMRNDYVDVLVYPSRVQGEGAATMIAGGIEYFCAQRPEVDVIIIGRGGGSIEDLWAFNEEVLARAVYASSIPVISAVGHEVDISITDYVADRRAETPTAAAMLAAPDMDEVRDALDADMQYIQKAVLDKLRAAGSKLSQASPIRLKQSLLYRIESLANLAGMHISDAESSVKLKLSYMKHRTESAGATLKASDPAAILRRGYSVLRDADGHTISSIKDTKAGMKLEASLSDGKLGLAVEEVR